MDRLGFSSYTCVICFSIIYLFLGCTDNGEVETLGIRQLESEISDLNQGIKEKDLFIESLSNELSEINSLLDSIVLTRNDSLIISDTLVDPTLKISYFDSLLTKSDKRIENLEYKLEATRSDVEAHLLNTVIKDLRKTLEEKELMIFNLTSENTSLKDQNVQLTDSVNDQVVILRQLREDVESQEGRLEELKEEMSTEQTRFKEERLKLEQDLKQTKAKIDEEKALSYFNIAKDLLDQYDSTDTWFLQSGKKKMLQDMLNQAYVYFRKACLLGHQPASVYIRRLLTNKKYEKDLSIDQTGKSLTRCGI